MAVLVALTAVLSFGGGKGDGAFRIIFLDVGQGDSILFISPGGTTLLIDGGPNTSADWELQSFVSPYFCKLNMVLLTHPDADHVTGLVRVLDHCSVDMIFHNYISHDSSIYNAWVEKSRRFESAELYVGSRFSMSNIDFYTIWPSRDLNDKKSNNHSISLLVDFGEFEGLFMGDLENSRHGEVLENLKEFEHLIDRPFELLKASHHGATNGLDQNLASWVNPEAFVVSVGGKNTYGHPNQEVLDFMESLGAKIFRTDRDGTIEISVW